MTNFEEGQGHDEHFAEINILKQLHNYLCYKHLKITYHLKLTLTFKVDLRVNMKSESYFFILYESEKRISKFPLVVKL